MFRIDISIRFNTEIIFENRGVFSKDLINRFLFPYLFKCRQQEEKLWLGNGSRKMLLPGSSSHPVQAVNPHLQPNRRRPRGFEGYVLNIQWYPLPSFGVHVLCGPPEQQPNIRERMSPIEPGRITSKEEYWSECKMSDNGKETTFSKWGKRHSASTEYLATPFPTWSFIPPLFMARRVFVTISIAVAFSLWLSE